MRADNTVHLIAAASRRQELTPSKTIQVLREPDDAVTFEVVARLAEVFRSWLYSSTSEPKLSACATSTAEHPRRRCLPVSAPPSRPCCAVWKPDVVDGLAWLF